MSRQSRRKHGGSRDERREALTRKRSLAWDEAQQRLCDHPKVEPAPGKGTPLPDVREVVAAVRKRRRVRRCRCKYCGRRMKVTLDYPFGDWPTCGECLVLARLDPHSPRFGGPDA